MKLVNRSVAIGVSAIGVGVMWSSLAIAQTPGAIGGPAPRPDAQTAPVFAAQSYDPKGVPLGSFRLFPLLELDEVYNDNIYAVQPGPGVSKTGSFIQLVKPSIVLKSDWNQHMLNFNATGAFGFYSSDSLNNYQDFGVGTDGRYDIQREWNVYGGASFNRRHEDRGSPNTVSTSGLSPNVYNQLVGNVGYFQAFNRFNVRLDGRLDNYNYLNAGLGPTNGAIFNNDRNRTETREAARVGYEFSPGFSVWTRGSLNQKTYQDTVDSSGFYRSSTGFDAVGGVAVDFGGITSVEAFAGYQQQNYYDSRFPTLAGATFGLTGYWNPLRELSIRPFVRRTIEDSALNSTSGYINTVFGIEGDYQVRPNIKLETHLDYALADYNIVPGTPGTSRYDQYFTGRVGLKYSLNSNFWVGPNYQYVNRNSNQANSNYDQSVFMLRLGAQL